MLVEGSAALQAKDGGSDSGLGRRRESAVEGRAQVHLGKQRREAQLQADLLKRSAQHLGQPRKRHVRHGTVARVKFEDVPGPHATRTAGTLACLGLRDPDVDQTAHLLLLVEKHLLGAARVDDEDGIIDGDRRFGDVGRDYDLEGGSRGYERDRRTEVSTEGTFGRGGSSDGVDGWRIRQRAGLVDNTMRAATRAWAKRSFAIRSRGGDGRSEPDRARKREGRWAVARRHATGGGNGRRRTFRTPSGIFSNTADCSAGESDECNGRTRKRRWSPRRRSHVHMLRSVVMSERPGRKTRTAPSS